MMQGEERPDPGEGVYHVSSELGFWDWKSGSIKTVIIGPFPTLAFFTEQQILLAMCWRTLFNNALPVVWR